MRGFCNWKDGTLIGNQKSWEWHICKILNSIILLLYYSISMNIGGESACIKMGGYVYM